MIARMRLFTGIDLPETVLVSLERLLFDLRPTVRLNWSPVRNLHITTKFIGEWPQARLPELTAALEPLAARPAPEIAVARVGFFPNPHRPRVFFAGVKGGEPLNALAADTNRALAGLGIQPESRAYAPHLTLARIKVPDAPLQALREKIAALPSQDFGSFRPESFFLYLSELGPAGSVYSKLAEFPFEK